VFLGIATGYRLLKHDFGEEARNYWKIIYIYIQTYTNLRAQRRFYGCLGRLRMAVF
jgi:hypothetical protein